MSDRWVEGTISSLQALYRGRNGRKTVLGGKDDYEGWREDVPDLEEKDHTCDETATGV